MQPVATAVGLHDSWRPLLPAHAPGAGLGRRACGSAPPPPRRGHLPGPGVTPPPPCGTTRMPRAWSRGDGKEVQARQARHEEPCGYQGRHESHAPITPALARSGVYGGVRRLVDELCKYPGWRRDAARRARSGPVGPPANYQRKCGWLDGLREDQEGGRNRAGTRWLSTRDLWMGSQASADVRPAAGRRRIVHTGWFCQSAWFPNRSRPGLLAYRAREDGRCQPRAEQGPCDLSGRAGRGAAPPVAERADDVQPAAGLVEGAGRPRRRSGRARVGDRAQHPGPGLQQAEPDRPPGPGTAGSGQGVPQRVGQQLRYHDRDVWAAFCHAPPVQGVTVKSRAARTDPGSAPSARVAIRGSQGQRARAGSGDGRHLPLARPAISAAGISQRQPALPAG